MTVSAIREAGEEQLQEVDGVGPALAAQIMVALRSEQATDTDAATDSPQGDEPLDVAVDMATGEILDR